MRTDKEDNDFEKKIVEMEIPLRNFISQEEKETSWKEILLAVDKSSSKKRILQPLYWMAAASLLIILAVTIFLPADKSFMTSDQEKLNVNLADGSSVTLNHNSLLRLDDHFSHKNRKVFLDGEAFFNIHKDDSNPFVIIIGEQEVMVVGTSFNVNYKNEHAQISVKSGKVQLRSKYKLLNLEAGQTGFISPTGILSTMAWDSNDFSWYSKTLTLKKKSLKEVATILSELFNKKIEVSQSVSSCALSAKIEYESIDDILNVIKETLGIEWKYESNKIYIYGKGC